MNLETVDYQKRGAVAHVTLNRPEKANAMNARLLVEPGQAWADFRDDETQRVAVRSLFSGLRPSTGYVV